MNKNIPKPRLGRVQTQGGMVLLLCLIFLTALTLLGLSAAAEAILQNKLSANLQESEHAKQSALSALLWAENWLLKLDGDVPESCGTACDGLKLHAQGSLPANPEFKDLSWWSEQGIEAGIDPLSGERVSNIANSSFDPPIWIIEVIHEIPRSESEFSELQVWYRISARGSGKTPAGISVVESIVARSWALAEVMVSTETEASIFCPRTDPTAKCGRVSWQELR